MKLLLKLLIKILNYLLVQYLKKKIELKKFIIILIIMVGRLELIIGPMFASKSTELIKIFNRYKSIGKNILSINHSFNNRYNSNNITSHDNYHIFDSVNLDSLINIYSLNEYASADIIIIEELQFFNDAYNVIIDIVDHTDKIVICAGLSGDYLRNEFGDILKLIPHAEKITKLSAFCKDCSDGTEAHFTKKITDDNDLIKVGSNEFFKPVCRKHYLS